MNNSRSFNLIFAILCLGYLIDYYDLSIFAVARPAILSDLGVPDWERMEASKLLFNAFALGSFVGGIVSGIWGDKIGRSSAIRYGIALYSCALLLSPFIHTVPLFAVCRFVAGVGLAGELAASVTLLSEMSLAANKGVIASIVYICGILGGMLSTAVASLASWKVLFWIGGGAGVCLLFLRTVLVDPVLFIALKEKTHIPRGSLKLLLLRPKSLLKVLKLSILLAPMWLSIFFLNYAPEIADKLGIFERVNLAYCLFIFLVGSLLGALLFAYIGKKNKSRKKTIFLALIVQIISLLLLCTVGSHSLNYFSNLFFIVGLSTGYFGIYMAKLFYFNQLFCSICCGTKSKPRGWSHN